MIRVEMDLRPAPVVSGLVEGAALAALQHEGEDGDLTVVLTDDARLRHFNNEYLGIDAPTDVLAFPASEIDPDNGETYLGDILVSVPRAIEQAKAAAHPLASEVQLLVVHGVLHLLGYDHADSGAKRRMWKVQADVLKGLGLAEIKIREV